MATVLYSFSGILFGLDFSDTFYHLNQALHPENDVYLYPFLLSSAIIRSFTELVGTELIVLRLINSILLFSSMFLPFLLVKTERPASRILFYSACTLIVLAPFNVNILGYDTLSIFVNSLIFSVTLLYLKSSRLYLLLILSLLCSAAVLIRLPNVLVIPIVMLLVYFEENGFQFHFRITSLMRSLLFLFLALSGILVVYSLYYSGWTEFSNASTGSISHGYKDLISNYFKDGLRVGFFLSYLLISTFVFKKLQARSKILRYGLIGISHFLFIAFFVIFSGYKWNYALFLTALAIWIVLYQVYYHRRNRFDFEQKALCLYLLFLFVNPFGSNTGLLKAASLFLLLPFLLSISELRIKSLVLISVLILVPFAFLSKMYGIYQDKNVFELKADLALDKLNHIRTSELREDYLMMVDRKVKEFRKEGVKVYFYGDKSHIFHFLYPETSLGIRSFNQPVDELTFFPEIKSKVSMQEDAVIFLLDTYPGAAEVQTILGAELLDLGFERIEEGCLTYFFRR